MKSFIKSIALLVSFIGISSAALAQSNQFNDLARVINVQPLMEQQTRDCYQQPQNYPQQQERSNGGNIIGGIAGGLLGSQVGGGNGRLAATAVGALIGGLTGDRLDNRSNQQGNANCQNQYSNQVTGYLVTYEYNGRQIQKRMNYNPGQTVRVIISVDVQ